MSDLNPFEYFLCGGFGGICTVLVGHPLDTVKVRLQTGGKMYTGMLDCIQKTIKNEGILGLYKGIQSPLTTVAPIFAMSFFGYGVGAKIFGADRPDASLWKMFGAGAFSGIFTTIIMAPGERIKCLLQVPGQTKYDGMMDCAVKLYREGGISNIYRGTVATLLRDVPSAGLYFLTYNGLMKYFSRNGEKVGILSTIFAGGMSGVMNWVVGMPADVLKSRLQTAEPGRYPGGTKQVFAELMKNEGPLALYKGIAPVMLRAFPANAACFVGFEFLANIIRNFKNKK